MHLASIHLYPVKSCRGIAVESAELDQRGLVGDRRFLVVDAQGKAVTQRTVPRMALIETVLTASTLVLRTEGVGEVSIPRGSSGEPLRSVDLWSSLGLQAEDCGVEPAAWLSEVVGFPVRLVRAGPDFHRPVKPTKAAPGDEVAFTDAYPLLAISQASLDDLNQRLRGAGHDAVPMDRFRPNLVIAGCAPYEEDTWTRVRAGDAVLRAAGPCARCIMTTTDQRTGERGKEPLRLLASYRRTSSDPSEVNFGQNLIHEAKRGTLRVGAALQPA